MSKEKGGILKDAEAGDPVALARALVATPSVNPAVEESGTGEAAVAELTAGWLRAWGLSVEMSEVAPGRWNVVGRLEGVGVGPTLLLNGHLDTVGVAGMSVEPFGGELKDGRLWGRGSCDMKGGVAALLAATAKVARDPLPGVLVVALTADEEHASLGMEALVRSGMKADAAVVCEPTSLSVMPFWVPDRSTRVRSTAARLRPSIPKCADSFWSAEHYRGKAQPTSWTNSERFWTSWPPSCLSSR